MKRLLGYFVIVAFLVTVPFMFVAKQSLSDGEMGSLTAQEGVTVDLGTWNPGLGQFGNVLVTGFAPALQSWGDGDGFTGFEDSGWFGAFTTMRADSIIAVGGKMTIDVGDNGAGTTAIKIGLPSALLHTYETNQTLKLGTGKQLSDAQPALGTTYNDVFAAILNPTAASSITISSHAGEGVDINFGAFNPAQPLIAIPGLLAGGIMTTSWGDNNGYAGMTDAGFFGARQMTVSDGAYMYIYVSGTMSIDVGTDGGGNTGVRIALPTVTISPTFSNANITQPLALASSKDLNTNTQMLGTSYMGGLGATISGSVVISAH
jgi:hypothetical protein